MGRSVDGSRPYTEEEKQWLRTRSGGEALIKINERRFAHLSDEKRDALQARVIEAAKKEAEIQRQLEEQAKADAEDSYHPEDVARIEHMTIADLQEFLENEGQNPKVSNSDKVDGLTEKDVLVYRALNFLDDRRKSLQASDPVVEVSKDESDEDEDDSEDE